MTVDVPRASFSTWVNGIDAFLRRYNYVYTSDVSCTCIQWRSDSGIGFALANSGNRSWPHKQDVFTLRKVVAVLLVLICRPFHHSRRPKRSKANGCFVGRTEMAFSICGASGGKVCVASVIYDSTRRGSDVNANLFLQPQCIYIRVQHRTTCWLSLRDLRLDTALACAIFMLSATVS